MANPVSGIASTVRCYHCGETRTLDAKFWSWLVIQDVFSGKESSYTRLGPVSNVAYAARNPQCAGCHAELDPVGTSACVAAGHCFCPGCGVRIAVRAPDANCAAIDKSIRAVVGELDAMPAVQAATHPVLFACMGCGGGLRVDGTTRSVTCEYCEAANYLPDGLWQQLRPVPKASWFYLLWG
jgi:hypothetical protein